MKSLALLFENSLNRSIYIWGTGLAGKRTEEVLRNLGFEIDGFVSSFSDEESLKNYEILSPKQLKELKARPLIVIGAQFFDEITKTLNSIGFKKEDYVYNEDFFKFHHGGLIKFFDGVDDSLILRFFDKTFRVEKKQTLGDEVDKFKQLLKREDLAKAKEFLEVLLTNIDKRLDVFYSNNGGAGKWAYQKNKTIFSESEQKEQTKLNWQLFFFEMLNTVLHSQVEEEVISAQFFSLIEDEQYRKALIFSPLHFSSSDNSLLGKFFAVFSSFNPALTEDFFVQHEYPISPQEVKNLFYRLVICLVLKVQGKEKMLEDFGNKFGESLLPDILAETGLFKFNEGESHEAIQLLQSAVENYSSNSQEEEVWQENLKLVLEAENGKTDKYEINYLENKPKKSYNKIFTCGFEYSGSGAVFDFLKEFYSIDTTIEDLGQELGIIGRKNNILNVYDEVFAKEDICIEEVVRFLMTHGLGLGLGEDGDFLNYRFKTKRILSQMKKRVYWGGAMNKLIADIKRKLENFQEGRSKFADEYLESLIDDLNYAMEINFHKKVLLDNWFPADKIHLSDYFSDSYFIVVKRDPRSQFVEQNTIVPPEEKEDKAWVMRPQRSVGHFISFYKSKMNTYLKNFQKCEKSDNIIEVQFEEFVTSESHREQLVNKLQLDLERRDQHKFFNPSESRDNIDNFSDYTPQTEIEKIETELSGELYL